MSAAFLADRAIIEILGRDSRNFLQNLITADMDGIAPGSPGFGALLSPQGKILFDFLILADDHLDGRNIEGPRLLLDTWAVSAPDLAKRLNFYKLRAKVEIIPRHQGENALGVLALCEDAPAPQDAFVYADPRARALGRRAVVALAQVENERGGREKYDAARIDALVPEAGVDYPLGEYFPHDVNMDALRGVSFDKGCYVGQEVVSRMHHRGAGRKRVIAIAFEGPAPAPKTEFFAGETLVGIIGTSVGGRALALARLDRLAEAQARKIPLKAGASEIKPLAADVEAAP